MSEAKMESLVEAVEHGTLALPSSETGMLHLLVDGDGLRARLREAAAKASCMAWPRGSLLCIRVDDGHFEGLIRSLANELRGAEAKRIPVVFQDAGSPLDVASCMDAQSLDALFAQVESRWLRRLISADRVTSVFQPIVDAQRPTEVIAYECLLRGLGHDGEFLSPEPMLNLARRAGWLAELDRSARRSALRCASDHALRELIFVNLSPVSLRDPARTLRESLEMIDEAGLRHSQVVFEIIESDEIADFDSLHRLVRAYREAGCLVALDDLGSGYASLRLLAELRPDFVKIDMSLVRNVDRDRWRAILVTGILQLARELGMRTIAEGVESASEMKWLQENGADLLQGYYLAAPAHTPPAVRRYDAVASAPEALELEA